MKKYYTSFHLLQIILVMFGCSQSKQDDSQDVKRPNFVIILVDDIFSELDLKRRSNMIDLLKKGNQVIMTMVNANTIDMMEFGDIKRFEIDDGDVRET